MKGQKAFELAKAIFKKMHEMPGSMTDEKLDMYNQYFGLIKKAAYLGHIEALYDMGQQFEDIGFLGMPNPMYNPKKAIYWYTKAGEKGHADAYNNLSFFYDYGDGCEKDFDKSLELLKKSAELGSYLGKKNYKMLMRRFAKTGSFLKNPENL